VSKVTSDFVMDQTLVRVELRYATTMYGVPCVMTSGERLMLMWPVDSLDLLQQVRCGIMNDSLHNM